MRIGLALICFTTLLPLQAANQAEPSSPDTSSPNSARSQTVGEEQLVIANGVFSRNGRVTPATVRKLVEIVALRYPDATITIVGVDDVVIPNLTFNLRRWSSFDDSKPRQSLESILMAFSLASGRKFLVQSFNDRDFVLSAETAPSRQLTEVFNLSNLLRINRDKAAIEEELRRFEARLSVMRKRNGEQSPQVVGIKDEMEILESQLERTSKTAPSPEKLIAQIEEAVAVTLQLSSKDPQPDYKYHAGTNLLIAVGSDRAIEAVRKVIAALEKTPQ